MANAVPVITFNMGGPVLWEWVARGRGLADGLRPQRYQTRNLIQTEGEMRRWIEANFRNLEVLPGSENCKRVEIERPPGGVMSYKAYTLGIIDEVREEVAREKMRGRSVFFRSLLGDSPRQAARYVQTAPAVPGKSLLKR